MVTHIKYDFWAIEVIFQFLPLSWDIEENYPSGKIELCSYLSPGSEFQKSPLWFTWLPRFHCRLFRDSFNNKADTRGIIVKSHKFSWIISNLLVFAWTNLNLPKFVFWKKMPERRMDGIGDRWTMPLIDLLFATNKAIYMTASVA